MLSVVSLKQRSVRLLFGANLMHIHFTGEYKTKIIYLGGILFPLLSQLCASIFPIIFLFASFIRKTELICSGAKSWKHTNNLLKQIENNMHWRKKAKKKKKTNAEACIIRYGAIHDCLHAFRVCVILKAAQWRMNGQERYAMVMGSEIWFEWERAHNLLPILWRNKTALDICKWQNDR